MKTFLYVLLAALLATTSAGATTEKTWNKAEIWVKTPDGSFFNSHMDDLRLQARLNGMAKKMPTVVFFHDCGANRKMAGWHYARFLARAGFAVILPDSFARPGRPVTCEHWQQTPLAGAPVNQVHALRLQEIAYAAEQAKTLAWVDTANLFVMGHGEGGDAVAAFDNGAFKARVISGALCRWGIGAKSGSPVLFVASRQDRLLADRTTTGCAERAGKTAYRQILFPGFQHDTSSLPEARAAVIDFLKAETLR